MLTVKKKSSNHISNLAIYRFKSFNEYLDFCTFLANITSHSYNILKKSTLYLYKSNYYLCLYINEKNTNSFKSVHCSLVEFGSHINNSELFERKLKEYGKIIFKTNAINNCIKHFGSI